MRMGDEVRVSTPVSTASARSKPGICFPKAGNASRIGVARVAGILAHAVCDDAPRFGRRRHHRAARAHAEAVDAAPVLGVMHQTVFGGAELFDGAAIACLVDHALRMLDAKADGEGL